MKNLSKIHLTKFNKIVFSLAIILLVGFGTFKITDIYFHRQFQIFYSLDKKQNDQEIIKLINSSDKYIYFAIYTFTKDNIADALIAAKQRGVLVWGITDTAEAFSDYEKPIVEKLRAAGVVVETQKHPDGIMHIKAIVTDKAYAIGSYNWTQSATVANDEILEIGKDKNLHNQYFNILKNLLINNQ
ncbi:MAG: phospholipase D-like domain-containing protein [Candidatus Moranbacteria bacterium]|nr:phospholipase D-like domain-containing protein [Candidatus Moranbacteria bacterium]